LTAIFISHRSSDNADAKQLKAWLAGLGFERLFLDFDPMDGIPAGVDWEERIYKELRRCEALLIVLTPAWLASPWCGAERAIAREKGKKIFVVRTKPVPSGSVTPARQEVDLTQDRAGALEKLRRGLLESGLDPTGSFARDTSRPVFPGLDAFDVEDAAVFFGRDEESRAAAERMRALRRQPAGSPRLLLITGASGSGKSSLMRAGVVPRLRKERHAWIVARPFRRGIDPLGALATALASAWPSEQLEAKAQEFRVAIERDGLLAVVPSLRARIGSPEATVVLAIDQAEELLIADERSSRLLELLGAALAASTRELMALATIRSDQLGLWQAHPAIADGTAHGPLQFEPFPLGPMPINRVAELIRKPAELIDVAVEDALVDAIRAELTTTDALPLLAYTLRELHERFGADNRLTLSDYVTLGRLEGSVRTQADTAINAETLSREDREALRAAFIPRMVRATDDGGFAREPALREALEPRVQAFIQRLVDARLLRTGTDSQGRATLEIAHEALLRVWPLLAGWLADDARKLAALAGLRRAAAAWDQSGRSPAYLDHRDQRLTELQGMLTEQRWSADLESAERDYLAACAAGQAQRAKRRRLLQRALVAASLVLLASSLIAGWQWWEAKRQAEIAESRTKEAEESRAAAEASAERLAAINEQLRSSRSLRFTNSPGEPAVVGPNWYAVASLNAGASVMISGAGAARFTGSGFLAKGELFRPDWAGRTLLVTTSHVFGDCPSCLTPQGASFVFPSIDRAKKYPIGELLFASKHNMGLAILATVGALPAESRVIGELVAPSFLDEVPELVAPKPDAGSTVNPDPSHPLRTDLVTLSYGTIERESGFSFLISMITGRALQEGRNLIYRFSDSGPGASGAPVYDASTGGLICVHQGANRGQLPGAPTGSFCNWIYDDISEMSAM